MLAKSTTRHLLRHHHPKNIKPIHHKMNSSNSTTTTPNPRKKAFAPLKPNQTSSSSSPLPPLKGIIFDLDGTLTQPQNHMFALMRAAVPIPAEADDILAYIASLPPPSQAEAFEKIRAIEREMMVQQTPQPDLHFLLSKCADVRKAILTRNFSEPVEFFLSRHAKGFTFDPILTRDFSGGAPKPAPDGILRICAAWGVSPGETVMVGDSGDDMGAGRSAGALTVLVRSEGKEGLEGDGRTDCVVGGLGELGEVLEAGIVSRWDS